MENKQNFQVNLGGLIDLLSNHLYSGPQVFLRELLQNAVDAITARKKLTPELEGTVQVELIPPQDGQRAQLVFEDNGVGLTEDEVHRFLATIGSSSKREDLLQRRGDFIGQFGIGLLSAFMVSQEIVMITRSAREKGPAYEWRGNSDGTYAVRKLDEGFALGTKVFLIARPGMEEYFHPIKVKQILGHYGSLLPFPVGILHGNRVERVNAELPPWKYKYASQAEERQAYMRFGQAFFRTEFFDYVPLRTAVGGVEGAAFILPYAPSPAAKITHRVYLKHMLISEEANDVMPEWAFFAKSVIDSTDLRPTASRESFYEDETLEATRDALGKQLREYLIRLSSEDPDRLRQFIGIHALAIKALSLHDDECFRLFMDWMPFETSLGRMTLGEYRKRYDVVRYIPNLDQFRQVSRVAAAQNLCVINAGYIYDAELLQKLSYLKHIPTEEMNSLDLSQDLEDLAMDERNSVFDFIQFADRVLQPYKCRVEVKKFLPTELPTLYSMNHEMDFLRSAQQSKDVADELWSSMLDSFTSGYSSTAYSQLVFNFRNALTQKLVRVTDQDTLRRAIEMLYVQSLLMGHHPLSSKEMNLLNNGLMGLIEKAI